MLAHALDQIKALLETGFIQIIEKDAAYAARFFPVLQVKIFVAPGFVPWMQLCAERKQCFRQVR